MIRQLRHPMAIALAGLLFLATRAGAEEVETSQLKIGDRVVTVVSLRNQTYQIIRPEELADLSLGDRLVALEGKLAEIKSRQFGIYGTDRKMAAASADVFKGFAAGDNVLLGGRAERSTGGLLFVAQVAIKLKDDLGLFEDRFAAAGKAKDWEQLLTLSVWIEKRKEYNPGIAMEQIRRYILCRDRAVLAARNLAEEAFKDSDAAGYTRLALRLIDLRAEPEVYWRYLRRAVEIDPEQEAATKKLAEGGFLRCRGLWLTREEKAKADAAELERMTQERASRAARDQHRAEEAFSGAAVYAREAADMESSLAAMPGADAALRLASVLERTSSPRLGRRALFLSAALPPKQQTVPLAAAMKSSEPDIRCAALELSAGRTDLAARKMLAEAASADSSEEVAAMACKLLANSGDADALGLLVELTGRSDKEFRSRVASEALRAAADQDRYIAAEWRLWWARNKAAFPAGPKE